MIWVVVVVLLLLAECHVGANPSQCLLPNGSHAPCGPGNQRCAPVTGPGGFTRRHGVPQFHVMDRSCGEQDPNGPIYDPVHKVYHLFYQAHLGMPNNHTPWLSNRNGPVCRVAPLSVLAKHRTSFVLNDEDRHIFYGWKATSCTALCLGGKGGASSVVVYCYIVAGHAPL